jgi:hypothetical protein
MCQTRANLIGLIGFPGLFAVFLSVLASLLSQFIWCVPQNSSLSEERNNRTENGHKTAQKRVDNRTETGINGAKRVRQFGAAGDY